MGDESGVGIGEPGGETGGVTGEGTCGSAGTTAGACAGAGAGASARDEGCVATGDTDGAAGGTTGGAGGNLAEGDWDTAGRARGAGAAGGAGASAGGAAVGATGDAVAERDAGDARWMSVAFIIVGGAPGLGDALGSLAEGRGSTPAGTTRAAEDGISAPLPEWGAGAVSPGELGAVAVGAASFPLGEGAAIFEPDSPEILRAVREPAT